MSHPAGLLQPLPILEGKWECISMDFITGLPMVQGKDCIFVFIDRLTKYTHFFAISSHYTAAQVAEMFFREVFRLHGLPKTITSDRDSCFMGGFWQELFRLVGTELTSSTSYHPETDRQTEIVNKWLEGYLRNYVSGQQRAWLKWLHLGEYCYNTTHHMSIGMSPFYALIGHVAYELGLPQGSKIHNVFHVSCLKKALGQHVTVTDELSPTDDEGHLVLQPEAIIDTRERQLQSRTIREFLVRWKNLPDEDATWESEKILQHPSLQLLEDKKHFAGGDCNILN
eukprot:PITA_34192